MTGELPETSGVEAALELGASVTLRRLGGFLVGGFGFVVVPLLLVGDESDGDQSNEETGNGDFDSVHGRVEARVQEEEVGRGGDSEEENLNKLLAGAGMQYRDKVEHTLWTEEVNKMFKRKNAGVPIQPLIRFHL